MKADKSLDYHIIYRHVLYYIQSAPDTKGGAPLVVRVSKKDKDTEIWSLDRERGPSRRGVGWTNIGCRLGWRRRRPYIVVFAEEGRGGVLYAFPLFTQQVPRPVCDARELEYFAEQFRCAVHRTVVEWRRAA